MEKGISLICVLYYSKHLLEHLITNLYTHINKINEIIFIDNSNEGGLEKFENENIRIIRMPDNVGYGGAINYAIKESRYDNLIIINPDITIETFNFNFEDMNLEYFILGGIHNNNYKAKTFPKLIQDFFELSIFQIKRINTLSFLGRKEIDLESDLTKVDWISGSFIITTKATMEKLNYFDDKFILFYEETDLCKRAYLQNIPVFQTKNIKYYSNIGTKSSYIDVSEIKIKQLLSSFKRYYYKYSSRIIVDIVCIILKMFYFFCIFFLKILIYISKNRYVFVRKYKELKNYYKYL